MASHKPWGCLLPVHIYIHTYIYVCIYICTYTHTQIYPIHVYTQACINLCVEFIKLYTYTYMHIYIHIPTLTIELTLIIQSASCPIIIAAQYNYMILVPKPCTFWVQNRYTCAYRYEYPCMFVYIKKFSLPFMLRSCITTINSLFTIGFGILNSVKSTFGKLYVHSYKIYIIYIYD